MKRRSALIVAAYAAFAIAVFAARPPSTPGPVARDFEAYWSAGAAFDRHADPYAAAIWEDERTIPGVDPRREGVLPFVGPPVTLPVWSAIARLPYNIAASLWLSLLCGALGGLLVACLRGCGVTIDLHNGLAAVALAISSGPITSDLALGQFALVAAFGASLVVVARRTAAVIGGMLALAQPNVVPALVSQLSRKRTLVALGIAIVACYLLGAIALGWNWIGSYAVVLAEHAAAERFSAIQITPLSIAYGLGASPPLAWFGAVAVAAAAVACASAIARRTPDAFARFAAFGALTPFIATFWHEHDLVMAFPAALWCALRTPPSLRAVALAGTLLVAVDWLGLAQRPSGIAQSALLAIAAWCAFLALSKGSEAAATAYATVAVGVIFVAAACIAIAHPVPVWPAAMHATILPNDASAAQSWAAQQAATGLDRPVASWALLRALSLAGCALLAAAIYLRSAYCRMA